MAVSVRTGRIAFVLLKDGKLVDWELSRKAAVSAVLAATQAQVWIDQCQPEVFVTQKLTSDCTKSLASQAKIRAIAEVAAENPVMDVSVKRQRRFANQYLEAEALSKRFPQLVRHVPRKPKLWQTEPRTIAYFEALALACEVIDRPSE
jgi:hypothetical protein